MSANTASNSTPDGSPPKKGTSGWRSVLHAVGQAPQTTAEDHLLLAIAYLDRLRDPAAARQHLKQASIGQSNAIDDSFRLWLSRQLAILSEDAVLLEEALFPEPHLLHALMSGNSMAAFAGKWASRDDPTQNFSIIRALLLCVSERWKTLAGLLAKGEPAERLLSAFIHLDLLGNVSSAHKLLTQVAPSFSLLANEFLIEAVGRNERAQPKLTELLQQRQKLVAGVAADNSLEEKLAALWRGLLGEASGSGGDAFSELPAEQCKLLVSRLGFFSQRSAIADDAEVLAKLYLSQADTVRAPFDLFYRLRAAACFFSAKRWAEACSCTIKPFTSELEPFRRLLRTLCYARLNQTSALIDELAELAQCLTGRQTHEALIFAMILAWNDAEALSRLHAKLEESPEKFSADKHDLDGVRLSIARRMGKEQSVHAIWLDLSRHDERNTTQGLYSLGALLSPACSRQNAPQLLGTVDEVFDDRPVFTALAAMAGSATHGQTVVAHLRELAHRLPADKAHSLLRASSDIAIHALKDHSLAKMLLESALRVNPGHLATLEDLAALHFRQGDIEQTLRYLRDAANVATDKIKKASIYCRLGDIYRRKLRNRDEAITSYQLAIEAHGHYPRALKALRLLLSSSEPQRLVPILERLLSFTEKTNERVRLHIDLARAHQSLWKNTNSEQELLSTLACYANALAIDGKNEVLANEFVTFIKQTNRHDAALEHQKVLSETYAGLGCLLSAFEEKEDWRNAIACCEKIQSTATERASRVSACLKAAQISLEKLKDAQKTEAMLRLAIELDPSNRDAYTLLRTVLSQTNRWQDLVLMLRDRSAIEDSEAQANTHVEIANIIIDHLKGTKAATKHLELALELDSANVTALDQLERVYESQGNDSGRVRILERALKDISATPEALDFMTRLGHCYQRLGDDRSALRIATRSQTLFPTNEKSFSFAEAAYRQYERYSDLCELYARRIQFLQTQQVDTNEIAQLLQLKGQIEFGKIEDLQAATATFMRLLELVPGDRDTLGRLERIFSAEENWERLLTLYERQADVLKDNRERVAFLHRAVEVAKRRLRDEAQSARLYERIYSLDPTDTKAFASIETKLERQNDYKRLITLLSGRAHHAKNQSDRIDYMLRAAAICERIPDIDRAVELYSEAEKIDPNCATALDALARIYESLERWRDFLRVMERQVELESDTRRRALMYFKCGSVMETQFSDDERAFRYYRLAVQTSSACLPALHGLRDLHSRREEWPRVVETLELEARITRDRKGRADMLARIAEIYDTKLLNRSMSFNYYRRAIETHNECLPAAISLFKLYREQHNYNQAARWGELCARKPKLPGSATDQAKFYVQWGEVLHRVGRPEDAANALIRALQMREANAEALLGLLELSRDFPQACDYATVVNDFGRDKSSQGQAEVTALLSAMTGILEERNAELDRALQLYQHAHEQQPNTFAIVRLLADLLVLLGRASEAVAHVQRCRNALSHNTRNAKQDEELVEIAQWMANHELVRENRPEQAASFCREALEIMPDNEDVLLTLVRSLMLCSDHTAAYREMESLCGKAAARDAPPHVLAHYFHMLGTVAMRNGKTSSAEANWRRACEMSPSWAYSYLAIARRSFQISRFDVAERELRLAEQGLEEASPDVFRAQAEFYKARGFVDRAVTLYHKAVRLIDADVDDRVALSMTLAQRGEADKAAATLFQGLSQRPSYLPTYEALHSLWQQVGNQRYADRSKQVINVVSGNKQTEDYVSLVLPTQMHPSSWDVVTEELRESAVYKIFSIVSRLLDGAAHEKALEPASEHLIRISERMERLFSQSLKIGINPSQRRLIHVANQTVHFSPLINSLPVHMQESALLQSFVVAKLRLHPLFFAQQEEFLQLADFLRLLVTADFSVLTAKARIKIPRRLHRELSQLKERNLLASEDTATRLKEWSKSVHFEASRIGLLLTESFSGAIGILAIRNAIPVKLILEGAGLLGTLDDIPLLTQYYLSDQYDQHRSECSKG